MGIVYHTRYLDFWEWSRTEFLRDNNIPYAEIEEKGFFLPCINLQIDYKSSAKYDDLLRTELNFSILKRTRLIFKYKTYHNNKLLNSGFTQHIFTNITFKPVRIPEFFEERFSIE